MLFNITVMEGRPLLRVLLPFIIHQYLSNTYCLTIVTDERIDFNFSLSFTVVTPFDELERFWHQLLEVSERGCSDYIINMKDPQKFMIALDQISRRGVVRRSDKKIIILPYSNDAEYTNSCLNVLSKRESSNFADILLILRNNNTVSKNCEVYDLMTHEFLKPEDNKPLFMDQWNSCSRKFDKNFNLFPHNLKNLNGKVIKVATFTYPPYASLDLDADIDFSGRDGVEMRIAEHFCRWINCSIEIVNEDKEQWGEIFDNGTGVGVTGSVVFDKADMGFAAIYSWYEYFVHMDFSAPCTRSSVTLVAPSPRLLTSWNMPLLPFSWFMWYAVIITFIFACVCLIIAKGCSSDKVLLTVFGILLSQSQYVGSTWRIRSIIGWLLAVSMVLFSAYGAGLASIFTVPKYEPSIDTIQDVVDRKMEWGATHDAWILSLASSEEPLIQQLVSLFRIKTAEELIKRSFMGNMAFSIERLPAGYFSISNYITKEALLDMTVMVEDLYFGHCVIVLRKSSPYTEKLSELILRLHQSGLLLAWETQVAIEHLSYETQLEVKLSRSKTDDIIIEPLNLKMIGGVFIVYGFGVLTAVLVFMGELFFYEFVKKAKLPGHIKYYN